MLARYVEAVSLAEYLECARGLRANRALHDRSPAQKQPFQSERLAGPCMQVKGIGMVTNLAILKYERSVYAIMDRTTRLRECVPGLPVRGAGIRADADVVHLYSKVGRAFAQHAPHSPHPPGGQMGEYGIVEVGIGRVAGRHGAKVPSLKGIVEGMN